MPENNNSSIESLLLELFKGMASDQRQVATHVQQIQVDIAEIKAGSKGESVTVNQRLTKIEEWQGNVVKILVGAVTTVIGGGVLWLLTHR